MNTHQDRPYHIKEEFREQYTALVEAASQKSVDVSTYIQLGDICHDSGILAEAKEWFAKALTASGNDRFVEQMIREKMPLESVMASPTPFYYQWNKLLAYPIRDGGWLTVVLTGAVISVPVIFPYQILGIFLLIFYVLVYSLFLAYLLTVIETTITGSDSLPTLFALNFDFYSDALSPALRSVGVLMCYAGPWVILYLLFGKRLEGNGRILIEAGIIWVHIFLPAAYGLLVISSVGAAVNPFKVIFLISKVFPSYVIGILSIIFANELFFWIAVSLQPKGGGSGPFVFLAMIPSASIAVYANFLAFHIVGRIFRDNVRRLGLR